MSLEGKTNSFDINFFNPFIKMSWDRALIAGVITIILAAIIGSFSNTQFDGVLNIHPIGLFKPPLYYLILLNILNWLLSTLVFLVFGAILTKSRFRIIDIVSTQAFARWPNILFALAAFLNRLPLIGTKLPVRYCIDIVALLSVCLMVTLMYNSYKISFDLKGGRLVSSFILGLFLAQTVSLILIYNFLQKIW